MTAVLAERRALYGERTRRWETEAAALSARSRLLSNLRGLSFGLAVVSAVAGIATGHALPWLPLVLVLFAAFAGLVVVHVRVIDAEDLAERWVDVNRAALSRLEHEWSQIADDGKDLLPAGHAYAGDLDLFGQGSLFQRLSVAHTRFGRERLAALLLESASADSVRARQSAVRALAADLELRQRFEAHSLGIAGKRRASDGNLRLRSSIDPASFLQWAEEPPALLEDKLAVYGAWLLPPLTITLSTLYFLGRLALFPMLISLCVQALLLLRAGRVAGHTFAAVSSTEGAFLRYGVLLEEIERLSADAALLVELRERLKTHAGPPSQAMRRFRSIVGWFDLRHNGLIYPFVNLFLLWDIHLTVALERWRAQNGTELRRWFEVIGWFEALSSLASFAADEPGTAFAEIDDGAAHLEAEGLAHPLIAPERRVANDVSLPGAGRALLVTGSNMSGKSTLMRAMGLALVLTSAGAPAVARRLKASRLTLRTSILVSDSLEHGVSHFYAEITKLKGVVDAAERGEPVLFLLDEILHGTNSRERQIGARWILTELLARGAIGAVSTHDQELCVLPDALMARVELVHLRENVQGGEMTFDYRVYPGPVRSGNALRLMRRIGLEVPLEAGGSDAGSE